jgi:hypothetical protein
MISFFVRSLIAFFALTGVLFFISQKWNIPLGNEDYWNHHGLIFLFFIATFPRLTLLFSDVVTGGWLWWLGWLFAPRVLVAVLATLAYWNQNPALVVAAWAIAWGGESSEKMVVIRRGSYRNRWGKPPMKEF